MNTTARAANAPARRVNAEEADKGPQKRVCAGKTVVSGRGWWVG
ncbi:hypothetical protein Hsw_3659 [Hymenobacter swuensis DY53]|uniref:Uncharacterized protein n=1 Tax=Hymenobacter swuensis DY53 TaxID=1227739 RepID=W8F1H5_9BACT|nr:hypothetical protein Hsw_3659 [Hymenobacter swuensis DY53]